MVKALELLLLLFTVKSGVKKKKKSVLQRDTNHPAHTDPLDEMMTEASLGINVTCWSLKINDQDLFLCGRAKCFLPIWKGKNSDSTTTCPFIYGNGKDNTGKTYLPPPCFSQVENAKTGGKQTQYLCIFKIERTEAGTTPLPALPCLDICKSLTQEEHNALSSHLRSWKG